MVGAGTEVDSVIEGTPVEKPGAVAEDELACGMASTPETT